MGRARYDYRRIKSVSRKLVDTKTGKVTYENTATFVYVPLTKRDRVTKIDQISMTPTAGDPPKNLLEPLSSVSGQSLEFSPNPNGTSKELKGIKFGRIAQYLVLRYLYEDEVWVNLHTWDLGSKVLEDWNIVFPQIPFLPERKLNKTQKRELFGYCLRFLLREVKPGQKPNNRLRYALIKALQESGLPSTTLYRGWEGMRVSYGLILSQILTRLTRPGKPPKAAKRRRSSEDSRGAPRANVRRTGLKRVALPDSGVRKEDQRKWYIHFTNLIAFHYATEPNEKYSLITTHTLILRS